MDGPGFETMMSDFLLPFIAEKMPNFHILHMDNAPSIPQLNPFVFLKIITLTTDQLLLNHPI